MYDRDLQNPDMHCS